MSPLTLQSGLEQLHIESTVQQVEQLQAYLQLLAKWNKVYNLTAITQPQKMLAYHALDSLSILQAIPDQGLCLDVGTGAGLPGIPLAIFLPHTKWVLMDSNGKKTRFVQQAIAASELDNVEVVNSRVQDYHADSSFDVIVSRAYASLQDFCLSVDHLWQVNTRLITMKTELGDDELRALDALQYQVDVSQLLVPGIAEKRSLVIIMRQET